MSMLTSCQPEGYSLPAAPLDNSASFIRDVSYGKDTAQRMDIYLPEGRSPDSTKAIILIHGGGWNSGSKNDFSVYIDSFRNRMPGYAIFNLNYRLVNGTHLFPAPEIDIKTAVDFIKSRSVEYGINKNKMAMLGVSAGGHLALLHAYKYKDPGIQAVIDFFGPTDLTTMFHEPWHPFVPYALKMITGTTPAENAAIYHQSSPVNFVHAGSAPTLIFHGSLDPIVHVSQSKKLKQKLEKAAVPHELVIYPGHRHGWYGKTLTHSFDRIEKFLDANVN